MGVREPRGARIGAVWRRFTKAVLRYTALKITQYACQIPRRCIAYAAGAFAACDRPTMIRLLLVLPTLDADAAPPEAWRHAAEGADAVLIGCAHCDTLVQRAHELAPEQILVHVPAATMPALETALGAWGGAPPCALSVISAPLDAPVHESLAGLGVQAWMDEAALDAPGLRALLARARARWQREASLRGALERALAHLDERKWIDRAKGLLMSARGIAEDDAFGLLRSAAMHANLRVGEVSRSVVEAAQWAEAINRAGQMRMLSQRLVRVAAQALAGIDARRGRTLRAQSVARMLDNLGHLSALALGPAGAQALADVRAAWDGLEAAMAARPSPEALAAIDARAEALLLTAEALTEVLESSGARRALRIVNLCGRQRMRAQRLAKDALLASMLPEGAWGQRLVPGMEAFEAALLELESAPLSSPEIRDALAGARDEWLRLLRGVRHADRAEGRADLVRSSELLVDTFDRLTASYEHSLQVIMS